MQPLRKWTRDEVLELRHAVARGHTTIAQIARDYKAQYKTTYDMIHGLTYKDVERVKIVRPRKMTPEIVREIKDALKTGELQSIIARRYGVSSGLISQIKHERIWANV